MRNTIVHTMELTADPNPPVLSPLGTYFFLPYRGLYSSSDSRLIAPASFPACRFSPDEEYLVLNSLDGQYQCRYLAQPGGVPFFADYHRDRETRLGFTDTFELLFCGFHDESAGSAFFAFDPRSRIRREICAVANEGPVEFQDLQGISTWDDEISLTDSASRIRSFQDGAVLCECPNAKCIVLQREMFLSIHSVFRTADKLTRSATGVRQLTPELAAEESDAAHYLERFDGTVLAAERFHPSSTPTATTVSPDAKWLALTGFSVRGPQFTVILDLASGSRVYTDRECSNTYFSNDCFVRMHFNPHFLVFISNGSGERSAGEQMGSIPLVAGFSQGMQSKDGRTILLHDAVRGEQVCQIIRRE